MNPVAIYDAMQAAQASLRGPGDLYELALIFAAGVLAVIALVPALGRWRRIALGGMAAFLIAGEVMLVRFHMRLYDLAVVIDPATGGTTGRVAVPLWVESEKLFVWALCLAVLGTLMRRQRNELLSGVMLLTSALAVGAALFGRPFTQPLQGFFGQYYSYLQAMSYGGDFATGAFTGMESARQFYYNAWYMWVHPPLLFLSYGCFAISFVATVQMIRYRHSSFETTAYRWARLGYLPLTFGMLIGFPWALSAWQGEAWWWSGKVNMSLMMWLLYTAVLHARLYLRRRAMWKAVAALSVLSFTILVMTYVTTYLVPGAHSYALAPGIARTLDVAALLGRGGGAL